MALAGERGKRVEALEGELGQEREAHGHTQQALTDLRVEAATLTERAAHAEELRSIVKVLQEQIGPSEG